MPDEPMTVAEIREKHGAFMDKFGRDVKIAWPTVYALLDALPSLADEIDKLRREINMVLEEAAKVADGYGAGIVPRRIAQDIRSLKRECSRYQRIR